MEMNYEVKGYIVISDETLMKSWNIEDLDKNKIWVSSSTTHDSRHVPVTKASWRNLDPRGQKLPRLLDGIVNTWKLFTYILVGHDGWSIDQGQGQGKSQGQGGPITVKNIRERRDVEKENDKNGSTSDKDKESLETGESSYVSHQIDSHSYSPFGNDSSSDVVAVVESKAENSLKADPPLSFGTGGGGWDLSPSDWDNKGSTILSETSNETTTTTETDGDVEVGEEDENESASNDDLLTGSSLPSASSSPSSSSTPEPIMDELESILLPTPLSSELLDSSSSNNSNNNNNTSNISSSTLSSSLSDGGSAGEELEGGGDLASTTTAGTVTTTGGDSSSVGVPLYHVEHAEPPTPPTWHRPGDEATLRPENNSTSTTTPTTTTTQKMPLQETAKFLNKTVPGGGDEIQEHQREVIPQRQEEDVPLSVNYDPLPSITTPPTFPTSSSTRPPAQFLQSAINPSSDSELVAREMELLLEHVQDVYLNMLHVVSEYKEFNESKSQEFSSEGKYLSKFHFFTSQKRIFFTHPLLYLSCRTIRIHIVLDTVKPTRGY